MTKKKQELKSDFLIFITIKYYNLNLFLYYWKIFLIKACFFDIYMYNYVVLFQKEERWKKPASLD